MELNAEQYGALWKRGREGLRYQLKVSSESRDLQRTVWLLVDGRLKMFVTVPKGGKRVHLSRGSLLAEPVIWAMSGALGEGQNRCKSREKNA